MAYSQTHAAMETFTLIRRHPALLVSVMSAVPSLVGNRKGIGLSWDSTDYVAVGLSMAAGRGALDVTGVPMAIRPPGLSVFVTLGDWSSVSPDVSLRIVNALCMVAIVWCTDLLLRRCGVRPLARWTGVAIVALSPALLDIFTMAWSEPPFIALILVGLVIATRERAWPWDVALGVIFTALFFVRYVGPFYAAPIALVAALVQMRRSGFLLAFLRAGTSLSLSMVLPWLWLMRNKDLTGYLTGYRVPGGGTLLDPFKTFTATLGSWLIARPPLDGKGGIYLNWNDFSAYMQVAGVVVWIVLVASLARFLVDARTRSRDAVVVVAACTLVFLTYGGFSLYRFVYHEMGPLDSRMMSGLYVPIVVMLVVALDSVRARQLRVAVASSALVVLAWHSTATVRDGIDYGRTGRHWGSEFHRTVPIHEYAAKLPADAALYSNEPQSLFAATFHWPIRNQYMYQLPYDLPCSRRYFVWFNQSFLPDGKPVGGTVVYEDSWGQVIDLDACNTDIGRFWP
ncbi:MAG: ArnT family glycosyltransferase [Ilumatobacteraceae bacterium]